MIKAIIIGFIVIFIIAGITFALWVAIQLLGAREHEARAYKDELPWCCLMRNGERCKHPDIDCVECEILHEHFREEQEQYDNQN